MKTLPAGSIKRIHVNGAVIRANKKNGTNAPVFTVKTCRSNDYGRRVTIHGPAELTQDFERRLGSGAVAWITTRAAVEIR